MTRQTTLYHYCKLSTALEYILPDMQLRLSPMMKTNDPRENKGLIFGGSWILGTGNQPNANTSEVNNERFSKILRTDCKLLCFSVDDKMRYGYELSRMWAQYGDNHKGVCLAIDREVFSQENSTLVKKSNLKPVKYILHDKTTPIRHPMIDYIELEQKGEEAYLRGSFRKEFLDYLYFSKDEEWSSEKEFRMVYFSEEAEDSYCSIKSSLKTIYLGVDFNTSYLPAIKALQGNAKVSQLRFDDFRLLGEQI